MPATMLQKRQKRAKRTRHTVKTAARRNDRLRLSVYKSNEHIYAQVINDAEGKTLVSASTMDKKISKEAKGLNGMEAAKLIGTEVAKRATKAGVTEVFFDRGGYHYTGQIQTLADAARAAGLKF